MVYGHLNQILQDAKKALYLYCVSYDVYYDEELYEQLKSVDDEDKVLYAFSNMPDPELIKFKLK